MAHHIPKRQDVKCLNVMLISHINSAVTSVRKWIPVNLLQLRSNYNLAHNFLKLQLWLQLHGTHKQKISITIPRKSAINYIQLQLIQHCKAPLQKSFCTHSLLPRITGLWPIIPKQGCYSKVLQSLGQAICRQKSNYYLLSFPTKYIAILTIFFYIYMAQLT